MNAIGALILVILILVVLFSPRKLALLGMMAGVMYLTQNVAIDVAGFNCFSTRFLELAGFIRVMGRREFSFRQLNGIDRALILLYGFTVGVFLLRSNTGQAYQIGTAVDAFLSYFTFRGLLSDMEEFRWFLRAFIFMLVPYTLLVVSESRSGIDPFTQLFGGVGVDDLRNGRPRCIGSFREPDLLGMFAASFIPLFVGLVWRPAIRKRALFAICLLLVIVWAANSGGAAAAAMTGLACWGFWRFRTEMRKIRWGLVGMIIALALVMKAPVWYIFARASNITGGDGWHRSYLIDVAYRHLGQWWLVGMPIRETYDWFPYHNEGTGAADITNLFIGLGVTAGLAAIALFIVLLTRSFRHLGRALAAIRSNPEASGDDEFLLWGLGVMLVVHIIDWFGLTYFDQMYVVWFMQLAAVSSLCEKYAMVGARSSQIAGELEVDVDKVSHVPVRGTY